MRSVLLFATSNAAVLTVHRLPTVELVATPSASLFPWQSTILTATPIGSGGVLSNTWVYNNTIVPNTGNARAINFDQLGNYQVEVRERWPSDLVCTNRSGIVTIAARDTARLIIYPNPNHGQFRISYFNPSGLSDLQVVTIFDSKGARVYRARFVLTGISTSIDISRLSLSAGFYSVVIGNSNGIRIFVGKLIVY